jgi:hypothetical protein
MRDPPAQRRPYGFMIGADDGGVNTIKTHTSAIYRKLAVTSRAAAVTRAAELGLLTDSH